METSELLNSEDEKLMQDIQLIKQNIASYIGRKNIVDQIKTIIKESKHFSFTSKRTEKYISLTRPLFIIAADREKITNEYGYIFTNTVADTDIVFRLIQEEITSKYSDFISTMLRGEDFINVMKNNNIEIDEETLNLASFVTSSIFGINMEVTQNIIYIEFVI